MFEKKEDLLSLIERLPKRLKDDVEVKKTTAEIQKLGQSAKSPSLKKQLFQQILTTMILDLGGTIVVTSWFWSYGMPRDFVSELNEALAALNNDDEKINHWFVSKLIARYSSEKKEMDEIKLKQAETDYASSLANLEELIKQAKSSLKTNELGDLEKRKETIRQQVEAQKEDRLDRINQAITNLEQVAKQLKELLIQASKINQAPSKTTTFQDKVKSKNDAQPNLESIKSELRLIAFLLGPIEAAITNTFRLQENREVRKFLDDLLNIIASKVNQSTLTEAKTLRNKLYLTLLTKMIRDLNGEIEDDDLITSFIDNWNGLCAPTALAEMSKKNLILELNKARRFLKSGGEIEAIPSFITSAIPAYAARMAVLDGGAIQKTQTIRSVPPSTNNNNSARNNNTTVKALDEIPNILTQQEKATIAALQKANKELKEAETTYTNLVFNIEQKIKTLPSAEKYPLINIADIGDLSQKVEDLIAQKETILKAKNELPKLGDETIEQIAERNNSLTSKIAALREIDNELTSHATTLTTALNKANEERQTAVNNAQLEIGEKIWAVKMRRNAIGEHLLYKDLILQELTANIEQEEKNKDNLSSFPMSEIAIKKNEAIQRLNALLESQNNAVVGKNNTLYNNIENLRKRINNLNEKKSAVLKGVERFKIGLSLDALANIGPKSKDNDALFSNLVEGKITELSNSIELKEKEAKTLEDQITERNESSEITIVRSLVDQIQSALTDRTTEIQNEINPDEGENKIKEVTSKDDIVIILTGFLNTLEIKKTNYLNLEEGVNDSLSFVADFLKEMNTTFTKEKINDLTDKTSNVFINLINALTPIIEAIKAFFDSSNVKPYQPQLFPSKFEASMTRAAGEAHAALIQLGQTLSAIESPQIEG